MIAVCALVVAALFGAGDQYLGSFSTHPWMADVSLLSAPWLVLAFLAGCTQRDPRRAAWLGLGCTLAALVGYGLMTLSPVEHADLTVGTASGFVRSSSRIFLAGLVTGPLFAWLGFRWRTERAWLGAVATAALLCLEPLAHHVRSETVRVAEVAAGLAFASYVAVRAAARERSG